MRNKHAITSSVTAAEKASALARFKREGLALDAENHGVSPDVLGELLSMAVDDLKDTEEAEVKYS